MNNKYQGIYGHSDRTVTKAAWIILQQKVMSSLQQVSLK